MKTSFTLMAALDILSKKFFPQHVTGISFQGDKNKFCYQLDSYQWRQIELDVWEELTINQRINYLKNQKAGGVTEFNDEEKKYLKAFHI